MTIIRRPQELWHARTSQIFDQDEGKEVEDHSPTMDYGHREVHYSECNEDTPFWKASGG
jgi:hypothetical protein